MLSQKSFDNSVVHMFHFVIVINILTDFKKGRAYQSDCIFYLCVCHPVTLANTNVLVPFKFKIDIVPVTLTN